MKNSLLAFFIVLSFTLSGCIGLSTGYRSSTFTNADNQESKYSEFDGTLLGIFASQRSPNIGHVMKSEANAYATKKDAETRSKRPIIQSSTNSKQPETHGKAVMEIAIENLSQDQIVMIKDPANYEELKIMPEQYRVITIPIEQKTVNIKLGNEPWKVHHIDKNLKPKEFNGHVIAQRFMFKPATETKKRGQS